MPAPDYVERCVEDLEAGRGDNVGGVWEIRPLGNGLMQRAIAIAAAHPFGVGDARYRYTSEAGYVDTFLLAHSGGMSLTGLAVLMKTVNQRRL